MGIFDADAPGALAFTRSLGRAGVQVRVYSPRRWPIARFSRWCSEWARCPEADDPERFQEFLAGDLRGGRIDLVAPTSDLVAFHAAEVHEAFAPGVRDRQRGYHLGGQQ